MGIGGIKERPQMQVAAARVAIDGCKQAVPVEDALQIKDEIREMNRVHAHIVDQ